MKSILALTCSLLIASTVDAGVYSDTMGKCTVAATSEKDKADLVKWMFANAALHPEVAALASISQAQRDEIDNTAGKLVERLLTDSCRKESIEALKYEGRIGVQLSFQILGLVASTSLMTIPPSNKDSGAWDNLSISRSLKRSRSRFAACQHCDAYSEGKSSFVEAILTKAAAAGSAA